MSYILTGAIKQSQQPGFNEADAYTDTLTSFLSQAGVRILHRRAE